MIPQFQSNQIQSYLENTNCYAMGICFLFRIMNELLHSLKIKMRVRERESL